MQSSPLDAKALPTPLMHKVLSFFWPNPVWAVCSKAVCPWHTWQHCLSDAHLLCNKVSSMGLALVLAACCWHCILQEFLLHWESHQAALTAAFSCCVRTADKGTPGRQTEDLPDAAHFPLTLLWFSMRCWGSEAPEQAALFTCTNRTEQQTIQINSVQRQNKLCYLQCKCDFKLH